MALRRDAQGTSSPFTFAIAGVILLAVIGTLLVATQMGPRDVTGSTEQNRRGDAESLLDLIVESQGVGWAGGADSVTSLGLRAQNGSGLDAAHLQALHGALYDATANGKLDYNETLLLLGLDPAGGQRFHLRIAPVGLQAVLTEDLSGIRTAYIADFLNLPASFTVTVGTPEQMVAAAEASVETAMEPVALAERDALVQLGLAFDDQIHLTNLNIQAVAPPLPGVPLSTLVPAGLLEGDVFPDQKQYLNLVLPARLSEYEVLVVGSNVDHSSLTSNAVKDTITDWVDAGGTLIVFGSDSQSFQWLEATLGVGIETANGGAYAPDVDHPLLKEPYPLDWPAYNTFEQAWGGKTGGGGKNFDATFQHVISEDDGDVLAVSLEGAYGEGRIFLSTFRAADIANEIDLQEAMNLINNLVVYADRSHLFLDYGPAPPQDQSVAAASRTSHIWDPELGQVPVRVTILVWG